MVSRLLPGAKSPAPTPPTRSRSPSPTRTTWRAARACLSLDAMIARLTGKLAETSADSAVIDVGGVGYLVLSAARTLDALGPVGGDVLVLTELQVREDAWTLFGFGSASERDSFRALTASRASAAGSRSRSSRLFRPTSLPAPSAKDDKAMIGRANGVGPKLAARIANELQGKLGAPASAGSVAHAARGAAAGRPVGARQSRLQARRRQRRRQCRPGRTWAGRDARRTGTAGAQESRAM